MSASRQLPSLPAAALLALDEGRLIEAIKIVRESERLDLTAAKARVDACVAADPRLQERMQQAQRDRRRALIKWALMVDAVLLAGILYWFFRR